MAVTFLVLLFWLMSNDALYLPSNVNSSFYFMHIPKTGGFTVNEIIKDLRKSKGDFGEYLEIEGTFRGSYDERQCHRVYKSLPARIITFFRNPIDLILSQYRHCLYSLKTEICPPEKVFHLGKNICVYNDTIPTPPAVAVTPGNGTVISSVPVPVPVRPPKRAKYKPRFHSNNSRLPLFGEWLNYFQNKDSLGLTGNHHFNCKYDPRNIQVRTMEGHDVSELWFIGLTELFETSYCTLIYQISNRLPSDCSCENRKWLAKSIPRDNHGLSRSRNMSSQFEIKPADMETAANISQKDETLYEAAKKEFVIRVRAIEQLSGKRILCPPDLRVLGIS